MTPINCLYIVEQNKHVYPGGARHQLTHIHVVGGKVAIQWAYSGQEHNTARPECPGQVNLDCGHVDFCCTGPAGMYFLLSFSIKNFTNHTHLYILPGNRKVLACNFCTCCNGAGNFLGHLSIGQVCFKLCSCSDGKMLNNDNCDNILYMNR